MVDRVANVTQVQNGYVVSKQFGMSGEQVVYTTFKEVVDALGTYFDEEEE